MRRRLHAFIFVIAFALTLLNHATASPTLHMPSADVVYRRQSRENLLTQTVTTQTVQTTQTEDGPVTETCSITLTPVGGPNGEPLVQVVRQCTVAAGAASGSSLGSPPAASSAAAVQSTSTSGTLTTSSDPSSSSVSVSPVISSVALSSITVSSPASTSASSTSLGAAVVGLSSVQLSSITNIPSSSSQAPATTTPPPAAKTQPPTTNTHKASPATSGTPLSAADNASSASSTPTTAAFQIPGKKISVLPIGLGIFAGISVIALIVVGLVTYERTKYRKIFRQRKLAEQGAGLGYGGLSS